MEEQIYSPEELEKIKHLRKIAEAERRVKKEVQQSSKVVQEKLYSQLNVDDKVFYQGKKGVIIAREKRKSTLPKENRLADFYYVYTVRCGIEETPDLTRFHLKTRTVDEIPDVEVSAKIKKLSTQRLLNIYKSGISVCFDYNPDYKKYLKNVFGDPDNSADIVDQFKAELATRGHVPRKKETKYYTNKRKKRG